MAGEAETSTSDEATLTAAGAEVAMLELVRTPDPFDQQVTLIHAVTFHAQNEMAGKDQCEDGVGLKVNRPLLSEHGCKQDDVQDA